MTQSVLIKDTTRKEREEIVRRGLSFCGDGSCEQCSGCSMLHAATTFMLGGGRSTGAGALSDSAGSASDSTSAATPQARE